MKDVSQIMRQAQAMQAKIAEAQAKLEAMEVEGSAGGGLVKLRMTGKTALLSVSTLVTAISLPSAAVYAAGAAVHPSVGTLAGIFVGQMLAAVSAAVAAFLNTMVTR